MTSVSPLQAAAAYPVSRGRLINVAATHCFREKEGLKYEGKLVSERTKEELLRDYRGWEDEVTQLLQVCRIGNVCHRMFHILNLRTVC